MLGCQDEYLALPVPAGRCRILDESWEGCQASTSSLSLSQDGRVNVVLYQIVTGAFSNISAGFEKLLRGVRLILTN